MDEILDETVSTEDLRKFEEVYRDQLLNHKLTIKAQFEYAWCLVRSKFSTDIRKGLSILEELFRTDSGEGKRDYFYYLAIGYARIKEYQKALYYVKGFLDVEPDNQQVRSLEVTIRKRMEKDAIKGMAVTGGVLVGIAGAVGLGLLAMGKLNK